MVKYPFANTQETQQQKTLLPSSSIKMGNNLLKIQRTIQDGSHKILDYFKKLFKQEGTLPFLTLSQKDLKVFWSLYQLKVKECTKLQMQMKTMMENQAQIHRFEEYFFKQAKNARQREKMMKDSIKKCMAENEEMRRQLNRKEMQCASLKERYNILQKNQQEGLQSLRQTILELQYSNQKREECEGELEKSRKQIAHLNLKHEQISGTLGQFYPLMLTAPYLRRQTLCDKLSKVFRALND